MTVRTLVQRITRLRFHLKVAFGSLLNCCWSHNSNNMCSNWISFHTFHSSGGHPPGLRRWRQHPLPLQDDVPMWANPDNPSSTPRPIWCNFWFSPPFWCTYWLAHFLWAKNNGKVIRGLRDQRGTPFRNRRRKKITFLKYFFLLQYLTENDCI